MGLEQYAEALEETTSTLISPLTSATLGIRVYFCLCIGAFYAIAGDPLFLVMLAVVGLGFMLTLCGHLDDRRRAGWRLPTKTLRGRSCYLRRAREWTGPVVRYFPW